jgi:hypothetical protein
MSHENVLPEAVRKQTEAADELLKTLYGEDKEEQPEQPEAEAKPEPEPEPEPEPKPEPKPEADPDHRYKVLKGKYDKEVPRLHRQLREAQQTNNQLFDRINKLEIQLQNMKTEKPKQPEVPELSQDEIDQFGPDLIDIIRRVAKQETGVVLDSKLKPVTESVKQVQETVAHEKETVAQSARRQLLEALDEQVPNWKEQNVDDDFLAWLDEEDAYAGVPRGELLAAAYEKNDAPRVIKFFKGFQKENAVVTPTDEPSNETPETSDEEEKKPEQPLDELVAPGTPKTGSAGAQKESGKKIWTTPEIQKFYAYKNEFIKANPEKDLPDNVVLIERDIFAAQVEGRIR